MRGVVDEIVVVDWREVVDEDECIAEDVEVGVIESELGFGCYSGRAGLNGSEEAAMI